MVKKTTTIERRKRAAAAKATVPQEPLNLEAFAQTVEGAELIKMAEAFRVRCARNNLPESTMIGGVCPFGLDYIEKVRVNAFMDGRAAERERLMQRFRSLLCGD